MSTKKLTLAATEPSVPTQKKLTLAELLAQKTTPAQAPAPVQSTKLEVAPTGQTSELSLRIKRLESILPEDLPREMDSLRETLLANPTACLILLPEDIGQLVQHIIKVKEANMEFTLAQEAAKKKPAAKAKATAASKAASVALQLNLTDFTL